VSGQELLILVIGQLRTAIWMQDNRRFILFLPQRHQYSLNDELPIHAMAHRPANYLAAVKVYHDR
jgi:hypothetical protein